MLLFLMVLCVAVPLAELALLIWVGGQVGLMTTVSLVIVTGILGASLARWQGMVTIARFRTRLAAGELPHEDLVDGIIILLAGAVLLTPGLLTDTAGFLLLVPAVRKVVRRGLVDRLKARVLVAQASGGAASGPFAGATSRRPSGADVVDADFEVKEVGQVEE